MKAKVIIIKYNNKAIMKPLLKIYTKFSFSGKDKFEDSI